MNKPSIIEDQDISASEFQENLASLCNEPKEPEFYVLTASNREQQLACIQQQRRAAFKRLFDLANELIEELKHFDDYNTHLTPLKKSLAEWENRINREPPCGKLLYPKSGA